LHFKKPGGIIAPIGFIYMKQAFLKRLLVAVSVISIIAQSLSPLAAILPQKAYAQEVTQDETSISPTPTDVPTPAPDQTSLTPTPTETPTPTDTTIVEPTPTPTDTPTVTPTPVDNLSPPADNNSGNQDSSNSSNDNPITPTLTPETSATPTPTLTEASTGNEELSMTILKNVSAPTIDLSAVVSEGSASLTTDKPDYAPTDTALITGSNLNPNESYTLIVSSDNEPKVNFETSVTADDKGIFAYAYQLDGKYRPNYKAELKDEAGIVVASTTFTDAVQVPTTVLVSNLQPDWTSVGGGGVFSAYIGPPAYGYESPGSTALYDGREAGIIKAGLNVDPTSGHYKDEGLLAFKVPNMNISSFASQILSYDVENETGSSPVWVRIRLVDGTQYQFVPTPYGVGGGWHTLNAGAGQWQLMDNNGNGTGLMMTLAQVAAANSGASVDRVYLTLGMGDSYNVSPGVGTVAWVDKVIIGTVTYDFVLAPVAPTTVKVTIDKYVNGVQATAANTNSASFPMHAIYPGGEGPYALSTTGFNNPDPYKATTSDMPLDSSYSTYETPASSCTADYPFSLGGYSTGTTLANAVAATVTTTVPNFTNLTSDKFIIVWNKTCPPVPVHLSPADNSTLTTAALDKIDWTDVTDSSLPITYIYQASNSPGTNLDGSFAAPVYTSGTLTNSEIPTAGTPEGVYYWHVRAVDNAGNTSAWSTPWKATVDNTVPTGTITINKIIDPASDSGRFDLKIGGTVYKANAGNGDSTGSVTLPTGTYEISETAVSGTDASQYATPQFSNGCVNGEELVGLDGHKYYIVLGANENKSCTITNTKKARIITRKVTNPTGSDQSFHFTSNWNTIPGFELKNGESSDTGYTLTPNTYWNVREDSVPTGWDSSVSCDNGSPNDSIYITPGQTVTCTFTNTKLGSVSGHKWNDLNANSVEDNGEPRLAGWEIGYYKKVGDSWISNTPDNVHTDASGNYTFSNLTPGDYYVTEYLQQYWSLTYPKSPTLAKHYFTITPGDNITDKNFGNHYDSTPPVITKTITGTVGTNGWYTSNVTVAWTVTDSESPVVIDSGCGTQTFSSNTTGVTSSCSASSLGGPSDDFVNLKIDKTAPTVSAAVSAGTVGSNGWYTSNVTVHFTCSDTGGSGVASCPADQILSTEGSSVSSTAQTAIDNAGNNSASSNVVTVKIDKTTPSAPSVTTPVVNGYITSPTTQVFTWAASSDSGSGLAATNTYQYQIDNNSNFSSPERDAPVNTTTKTLTNPLPDGTYDVRVRAKDRAGNYSLWSTLVFFTVDTTAPTTPVATPIAGDYTSAGVDVTLSSSDIGGSGVLSIYYTLNGDVPNTDDGTFYMGSSINITVDTTLKAIAYDNAGNASAILTATYGIPPKISGEGIAAVSANAAVINWTTDDLSTSRVVYGTVSHPTLDAAPNYGYASSTIEDPSKVLAHSVTLWGLTPSTTYYYRVISHGSPEAKGSEQSFSTTSGYGLPGDNSSDGGYTGVGGGTPSLAATGVLGVSSALAFAGAGEEVLGAGTGAEVLGAATNSATPTPTVSPTPAGQNLVSNAMNGGLGYVLIFLIVLFILAVIAYFLYRKKRKQ
jgi:hypothetical protein